MSKKKRTKKKTAAVRQERTAADKKLMYGNILRTLCLVALTLALCIIYRLLIETKYGLLTFYVYIGASIILLLSYLIYNRGFSRKGITPEMLPDTMSKEQKQEFIEDGVKRLRRSRPLLIVTASFIITLLLDIMMIIVLPFFKQILGF